MTRARIDSSPVVAGNRVYIGGNDGKLYVLDVATGKSVFEFEAGGAAVRVARRSWPDGSSSGHRTASCSASAPNWQLEA